MKKRISRVLCAVVLLALVFSIIGTASAANTYHAEYTVSLYRSHEPGYNTLWVFLSLTRLNEPVNAVEYSLHYDSSVLSYETQSGGPSVSVQVTGPSNSNIIANTGKQLHIKADRLGAIHGAGRMTGIRFKLPEGATGITRIYFTDMITTGIYNGTFGSQYTPKYPAYIDIDLAQDENILLNPTEPTEPTVLSADPVVPNAEIAPFLAYGNGLYINMRVEKINIPYHRVEFTLHYDPNWLNYQNQGPGDLGFSGGVTNRSSSNQFISGGLTLKFESYRQEDQTQNHPGTVGHIKFSRDPQLWGYTRLYISDARIFYFDKNGHEQSFVPDYKESFAVQMRETANMGYVNMYPTEPVTESTLPTTAPTTAPTTKPTTAPTTKPTTAPTTKPTTAPTTAPTTEPSTVSDMTTTTESSTSSIVGTTTGAGTSATEGTQVATPSAKPNTQQPETNNEPNSIVLYVLLAGFVIALAVVIVVIIHHKKR